MSCWPAQHATAVRGKRETTPPPPPERTPSRPSSIRNLRSPTARPCPCPPSTIDPTTHRSIHAASFHPASPGAMPPHCAIDPSAAPATHPAMPAIRPAVQVVACFRLLATCRRCRSRCHGRRSEQTNKRGRSNIRPLAAARHDRMQQKERKNDGEAGKLAVLSAWIGASWWLWQARRARLASPDEVVFPVRSLFPQPRNIYTRSSSSSSSRPAAGQQQKAQRSKPNPAQRNSRAP